MSLTVGIGSVAFGGTLGTLFGLVAATADAGWKTLVRAIDVLMSFVSCSARWYSPYWAPPGQMILAIGIVLTAPFARGTVGLSLKNREFVEAAQVGAGNCASWLAASCPTCSARRLSWRAC